MLFGSSTSSDKDNRDASSSNSFVFGCLLAQSKRRRSSHVNKVEEFLFAPPSQQTRSQKKILRGGSKFFCKGGENF